MRELDPKTTSRAAAFEMWSKSPQPMVTLTKTFDVTRIVKASRRRGVKFNMLMCWCIARAASRVPEFYTLPQDGRLMQYDALAVNVIVNNCDGGINNCDIPFDGDFERFAKDYEDITSRTATERADQACEDRMIIGTSAMVETELDSIVNQYSGIFNNPFLAWGKWRKGWLKTTLPISFQFHHAQMDGAQAAAFLKFLQQEINDL